MEVGLFHEKWSVEREQAIRNELYKGQEIEDLKHISEKSADIMYGCERFSYTLRNEYMNIQQIKTTKITVNNIHLLLNFGREFIR